VLSDSAADALWSRLSVFIAETTGLNFPPARRSDLQRCVTSAAVELGCSDAVACADWLLSASLTPKQLHILGSHLTVGETYFYRERSTFDALAQRILPELIERRRAGERRLRLWSAACSTGEEPYSLAILLRQLIPDWQDWQVTILATDISERSLQRAAAGVYGDWSFREAPPGFKDSYFTRTADGRFAIAAEIKKRVCFAPLNLAYDVYPSLATNTNAMDVILCRNVLMYFTAQHMGKVVERLRAALVDDGWLAVSPSECSHTLFSEYARVSFPGATLYRKCPFERTEPRGAERPFCVSNETDPSIMDAMRPLASAVAAPVAPVAPVAPAAAVAPISVPIGALEASEAAAESSEPSQAPAVAVLARALANQGKLADALACSKRWVAADKLDFAAHYLHATVLQELGEREVARRSLQQALYLEPNFALAHFALGTLARADACELQASKHFENALRLLGTHAPDDLLPESDGLTAGRLGEIIETLLVLPNRPAAPQAGTV
jgi:chemotaxis protein methyltransferase CheR